MSRILLIAWRNLMQHTLRTSVLGGLIAVVTAVLILLIGFFNGFERATVESGTTLMSGHVNVGGFYKVSAGQSAPVVVHAEELLAEVRKDIPEVDFITSRVRGWAKFITETGSIQSGVSGIDVDHEVGLHRVLQLLEGSLDALREPRTIVLFKGQAQKLGVKIGDVVTISAQTTRGVNNTVDVRVVGIASDVGLLSSFSAFVPAQTLRDLYQEQDNTTGALLVYLKDIDQATPVAERLRKQLAESGHVMLDPDPRAFFFKFDTVNREAWTGQKLDVTSWEEELSFLKWVRDGIKWVGLGVISILVALIAVGLMNVLWVVIRERTREIGTLRSMGMQRGRVLVMFLTEAFLLSAGGTLFGLVLGLSFTALTNHAHVHVPFGAQIFTMSDTLHLAPNADSLVYGLLFIVSTTTLVSLIPSFLAARLKPVTAMSQVG